MNFFDRPNWFESMLSALLLSQEEEIDWLASKLVGASR